MLKMIAKQKRYRSKVVWVSVVSLILLILNTAGVFDKIGMSETSVKIIADSILSILVLFGVLNNPTEGNEF
jgi:uncharacterized membrane protein